MNILLNPSIDKIRSYYFLDIPEKGGSVHIKGLKKTNRSNAELFGTFSIARSVGEIQSIEGTGVGHELMILFLCSMFRYQVQTIHLEATPLESRENRSIPKDALMDFYKKFGFTENPIAQNPNYPHKVPMILQNWEGLETQVQEFVRRITPRT